MLKTGLEVLQTQNFAFLAGKRVGLMTNPSAVDADLNSTYQIFVNAPQVNLVALFSPEHGFASAVQDGIYVASSVDSRSGLPIHSLYGNAMRPTAEMLADIEVLVCDVQDVGVRYYTYLWTISYILEAAGEVGVEVLILDRPNPLGGIAIEGAPLDEAFASLVGRFNIPNRHGMTLGELAQMINTLWNPTPALIKIIPCEGWRREMTWDMLGRVWIPPSPNMPHFVTALQYPGACLVEGTNLSEGRGTTLPFEIVGAPFVDGFRLPPILNRLGLQGVKFRPHSFSPTASKFAGEACHGVQVHITDARVWNPLKTWLLVLTVIHDMYEGMFTWNPHFDLLMGSDQVRMRLDRRLALNEIMSSWEHYQDEFRQQRMPFLLY